MTRTEAVVAKMNAVVVRLAVCLAMLLAGCSSKAETPGTDALKPLNPKEFQAVVDAAATELGVPGAMVLLRTPQGTVTAATGTTQLGTRTPPTADTHFRIASNTKTMTSALIVLLAQDGKLKLGDPVSAYLANVPNGENITLAQLLRMRSGLYGYTSDPALAAILDAQPGKAWSPGEALDIAFRHPPLFAPDAAYDYSNTNFALLGLVAEKVGGHPLAEQLRERLFEPLGLAQTSLPAADDTTMPTPYSHGYMYGGSIFALADVPYSAEMQSAARAGTLAPVDYTNQNASYAWAAGGGISTASDLATWITALVSGKVFNADYHQQWLTSLRAEDPDSPDGQKYGYGISYQRFGPGSAMFYHGGEMPGFNSFMGYDPDHDVALVIWTNLTLSPDGRTTANAMLPALLEEIYPGLHLR